LESPLLFFRFFSSERGNFAPVFAASAAAILTVMAAAVDYSNAHKNRSAMQEVLDAALLAASHAEMVGEDSEKAAKQWIIPAARLADSRGFP
jgi:Flp pilus assembly protein TadG